MRDNAAHERIAALEAKVAAQEASLAPFMTMLMQALKSLDSLAALYKDGIDRARVVAEQAEAAMANPPWASGPLHVTEDEEDLQYMRDHNMLSQSELESALAEAGLEPHITRL